MDDTPASSDLATETAAQAFIDRWKPSGGSELSNYQSFLSELCDLLDVPHADPAGPDNAENAYVFEKAVVFDNGDGTSSTKRIDLYKRGCFICETKQGVEQETSEAALSEQQKERRKKRKTGHGKRGTRSYDDTMLRAKGQAESYARNLPAAEGRPPFLMVIDVGHTIELYAEFSQTGGVYTPFPDPVTHRIKLERLVEPEVRETLRAVWLDPLSLDPAKRSAKVTREIAAKLAELAKSLEAAKHDPEYVATFLMRCLFTMFAEDIDLLPKDAFLDLLKSIDDVEHFAPLMEQLWLTMNKGGFSTQLRTKVLQFNGGLFAQSHAIPLTRDQLDLLIEAASQKWSDVEPAIFGTLLERALDPVERHKLGAHYTPRAYVERLVIPTVVEPLREQWSAAQAAAITLANQDKTKEAVKTLEDFHEHLCSVRVLDPACGSGNFLYVVLEHLKRLEGELFDTYEQIAKRQMTFEESHTVDPHQLLGIEINPRAAAIAELVLWIGFLQWHYRTRGKVAPPEPVIKNFQNIECRDAVLKWSKREMVTGEDGKPVTIWDGRTTKPHPVTGEEVPDETARVPMYEYHDPEKAEWPEADYVVGNPPFIGAKRMREFLGDGYVDALQHAWKDVPQASDYVLRWWHHSASIASKKRIERFGLIATNSIRQVYNRRVIEPHLIMKNPVSFDFATPDHPWVDSADGANVRISMSVCSAGTHEGELLNVTSEYKDASEGDDLVKSFLVHHGKIGADLSIGPDVASAQELKATQDLCAVGMKTIGAAFQIDEEKASSLGLGVTEKLSEHIKPYLNGRDLASTSRKKFIVDFYGQSEQSVRDRFPTVYQYLLDFAKPVRMENRNKIFREKWWVIGHPRQVFRDFTKGLKRYLATIETSKHRFFAFLPIETTPDSTLVTFGLEDSFFHGVMSSKIHVLWSLSAGGTLEDRPRYNKTTCFETFPFPDATEPQKARIRELGEQLDAHRKRQQELHPKLTMTGMYNVLEKLRSDEELTAKEKTIHEQGLVSVLRQIHDDLDAAVADAYGWPVDLSDEEILERLVALNHERAEEEKRGLVRWLRPEYQNPDGATQQTMHEQLMEGDAKAGKKKTTKQKIKKQPWPKKLGEQAAAVSAALAAIGEPADEALVAKRFTRANKERIAELLETLAGLGRARELEDGRFLAV